MICVSRAYLPPAGQKNSAVNGIPERSKCPHASQVKLKDKSTSGTISIKWSLNALESIDKNSLSTNFWISCLFSSLSIDVIGASFVANKVINA